MKKIKIFACILAASLMCCTGASCSKKVEKSKTESSSESAVSTTKSNTINMVAEKSPEAETSAADGTTQPEPEFDNAVEAKSGDAYLAINDNDWWIQYWGEKTDPLCYDAKVVHIDGNGDYTVSVTTNTDGYRYATTKDITDTLTPNGVGFAAVIIKDGEQLMPSASITVNSVKVDGNEIKNDKKSYTNTEEGNIRSNIFNEWVSDGSLPADARCADGELMYNGAPSDINDGSYSAQIISKDSCKEWTTIEVSFTVSGLDY